MFYSNITVIYKLLEKAVLNSIVFATVMKSLIFAPLYCTLIVDIHLNYSVTQASQVQ